MEEQLINVVRSHLTRDPRQVNAPFASDAELIELSSDLCLACTTDSLHEEIELGILENPWTIGWTAVNINLSDLAAVGVEPLGMLLAWTLPSSIPTETVKEISRGIADAATVHKTALLGGDVNTGSSLQICGTAFGLVPKAVARQRTGMKPGDRIFVTGSIGLGNALGFSKLQKLEEAQEIEMHYRPTARFDARPVIRDVASACIDSSDGLFASLDILSRLNDCGILYRQRPECYHSDARALASRFQIPLWLFAAAEHGEFELVFSVPGDRVQECLNRCRDLQLNVFEIGKAVEGSGFHVLTENRKAQIDIAFVRQLSSSIREDPGSYVQSLLKYSRNVGLE